MHGAAHMNIPKSLAAALKKPRRRAFPSFCESL